MEYWSSNGECGNRWLPERFYLTIWSEMVAYIQLFSSLIFTNDWRHMEVYMGLVLWPCAIWDIHLKRVLNSNLAKSRLPITYLAFAHSVWNFAQDKAVILSCSVQNIQTIAKTEMDSMDGRVCARFEFKIYIAQLPDPQYWNLWGVTIAIYQSTLGTRIQSPQETTGLLMQK